MPDKQKPAPSAPEPGQHAPMNTNPNVQGPDAPEVNTGTRMEPDYPQQEIDPDDVGAKDSEPA